MGDEKFYLLAFPITVVKPPDKVHEYLVPEEHVGFARSLLYRENIPHAVRRKTGMTGVAIYTAEESSDLENKVEGARREREIRTPPDIINQLISSTIRIAFIKKRWISSPAKLYNPDKSKAKPLVEGLAVEYPAVRFTVDDLGNQTKALFIDPASKIEFTQSLKEIYNTYPQQADKINFVKIMGTSISFYVVENEGSEAKSSDIMEKVIETINQYRGTEIDASLSRKTDDVIYVTPKSIKLSAILQEKISGLLTVGKKRVVIPLPKETLTPVGSLDNIALFGKVPTMTKPPHERFKQTVEILDNSILEEISDVKGIQISINTRNIIEVPPQSLHLTLLGSENRGWSPEFRRGSKRVLFVVTSDGNSKGYDRRCSVASSIIENLAVEYGLVERHNLIQKISLDNLEDVLKAYGGYGEKFAILLYDKSLNREEIDNTIGKFEYEAARQGFYPHELGIETDISEDVFRRKIMFKILNIMKDFATRVGAVPSDLNLNPPGELRDAYVVGIDATTISIGRSQIYLGVVVVTVKTDNVKEYHVDFRHIDESDIDVLSNIVKDVANKYPRALIMVNKSSIKRFLEELDKEMLQSHVLVGISKTHSYSRILTSVSTKRGSGTRYVNPPRSGVFVKLAPARFEDIRISRYLGVTTNSTKGEYEQGTIRPVIINIAGSVSHEQVLDYIQDLSHYASISSIWLPSLPWPLRKADKLCKKLNRIIRANNVIPESPMLRRL